MDQRLDYLSPEVNVFTVQTEGVVCTSANPNNFTETFEDGGYIEL